MNNGVVHVASIIIHNVMALAPENEILALYLNAKYSVNGQHTTGNTPTDGQLHSRRNIQHNYCSKTLQFHGHVFLLSA